MLPANRKQEPPNCSSPQFAIIFCCALIPYKIATAPEISFETSSFRVFALCTAAVLKFCALMTCEVLVIPRKGSSAEITAARPRDTRLEIVRIWDSLLVKSTQ